MFKAKVQRDQGMETIYEEFGIILNELLYIESLRIVALRPSVNAWPSTINIFHESTWREYFSFLLLVATIPSCGVFVRGRWTSSYLWRLQENLFMVGGKYCKCFGRGSRCLGFPCVFCCIGLNFWVRIFFYRCLEVLMLFHALCVFEPSVLYVWCVGNKMLHFDQTK